MSKVYAVRKGRVSGIYSTWAECQAQTSGFKGAEFKSFKNRNEAEVYLKGGSGTTVEPEKLAERYIAVDGGTHGNHSDGSSTAEFQVYCSKEDAIVYRSKKFVGTNNIGEYVGLAYVIKKLHETNDYSIPIYTDSMTAMAWVRNRKANTKLDDSTVGGAETMKMLARTEAFLKELGGTIEKFDIRKWETRLWGENPADFGRK